jgi:hypothetical protein
LSHRNCLSVTEELTTGPIEPGLNERKYQVQKVFGSHAEVCHIWANQSQSEARTSNVFFEGTKIYSYGYHYLAGMIHETKGKRFALVRSDTYSPSTSKHLCRIRGALSGLMPYFCAPNVENPKEAVKHLDAQAQASIELSLKRVKVSTKQSIQWAFESIHTAFSEANELRKLIGMGEKWPTKKQLDAVQKHLEKRLARYHELNTPEMIAKREAEKTKREERKQRLESEKLAKAIDAFRTGYFYQGDILSVLPYELIRIEGDSSGGIVRTTRGAKVPLPDAIALYKAIKAGLVKGGERIGHYTFNGVFQTATDEVIRIGCHRILMSEADAVLGAVKPHLQLVKQA